MIPLSPPPPPPPPPLTPPPPPVPFPAHLPTPFVSTQFLLLQHGRNRSLSSSVSLPLIQHLYPLSPYTVAKQDILVFPAPTLFPFVGSLFPDVHALAAPPPTFHPPGVSYDRPDTFLVTGARQKPTSVLFIFVAFPFQEAPSGVSRPTLPLFIRLEK